MHVEATTTSPLDTGADTIVVPCLEGEELGDEVSRTEASELIRTGEAKADFKHLAVAHGADHRLILIGLGSRSALDADRARVAAAVVQARARELSTHTLCWQLPEGAGVEIAAALVQGMLLASYRFVRYKPPDHAASIERLIISAEKDLRQLVETTAAIARAQNRARDLANTPANELSPAALAEYAHELASAHGIDAAVLTESEIRELGMGAFAAVAQGSQQEARLIRLEYNGAAPEQPRLALVGKAVTFDSGGLSLKSPGAMHDMKFDMAGGAAVIEAVAALAELEVPVRVLAVVGATENLPSGGSIKPGDIVRALDGTTIEVNNTDAEGRLVLADCISYARNEGCERILDIATLTGGILTALGSTYAGLMSNDQGWAQYVEACGRSSGEPVWRLPLHPDYAEMIKGRYAQFSNAPEPREATPITAAELLHHFAGGIPWAHVDIAGTAWDVRRPYFDRGATGFGVRLLVEVARGLAGGGEPG